MDAIKYLLAKTPTVEVCPPAVDAQSMADLLRRRALMQANDLAYAFLAFGRTADLTMTYGGMDERANAIGRRLSQYGKEGDPVLLVYPSARGFIEAFFGCLYAGRTAVPALPPRTEREARRLASIIRDCKASVSLTCADELEPLKRFLAGSGADLMPCFDSETIEGGGEPLDVGNIPSNAIAFVQYTSGSTSDPKGVLVGHDNLLHNQMIMREHSKSDQGRWLMSSWLPHYHDMGLIGGILHPIFMGRPVVLFSPLDFLQQPMRWLRVNSAFGVTTGGGPNFAYDLCVRRARRLNGEKLDLSQWTYAFCGAEPVRQVTLTKFAETFAASGFKLDQIVPCYGLAEATLMVTSNARGERVVSRVADYESLTRGKFVAAAGDGFAAGVSQVASGTVRSLQDIRIISPESGDQLPVNHVGEICVRGGSVCKGFFGKPELSEQVFNAYADKFDGRGFLRTGDLGFVDENGQLFISGRLKDLLIHNGVNHYPQDIELAIESCSTQVRPGRVAAFNLAMGDADDVLVVCEVETMVDAVALTAHIHEAVWEQCNLQLGGVILARKGQMPLTSSGKIQRGACRKMYLAAEFELIHERFEDAVSERLRAANRNPVVDGAMAG